MLVLCGSSINTMGSEVLVHKSPLYGRQTGQIDLQPFSFRQAREAIDYDIADAIRSYSITGGTPMSLTLFEYERALTENATTEVLVPTAVLYNEPEFLLRTELRNPARYMSIRLVDAAVVHEALSVAVLSVSITRFREQPRRDHRVM
ncbi:ATPase [Natronolimnohabitans innermongolicus JCM 12255]|uniref:ATPase n=1 Tax=Natronolimnohabitans innermongolicus JCM 12255 TaxID=1227499 RepID=L9WP81_9EURY|nr:ATPase [Natronolimnohabitans innermongolicus JCM 12255]